MFGRIAGEAKRLYRRYAKNEDINDRTREVMAKLAEGKEREARALRSVSDATGDVDVEARARNAEREAERMRRKRAEDVAMDVFMGGK